MLTKTNKAMILTGVSLMVLALTTPAHAIDLGGTLNGVTGTVASIGATNGNTGNSSNGAGRVNANIGNATHILGTAQARHNGNKGTSALDGLIGAGSESLVSLDAERGKGINANVSDAKKVVLKSTATSTRTPDNNDISRKLDHVINLKGLEQADTARVSNGTIILGSDTDANVHADRDSLTVSANNSGKLGVSAQSAQR